MAALCVVCGSVVSGWLSVLLLARVMVLQQALDRVSPTLSQLGECSLCLDSLSSSGLSGHLNSWIPVDVFFNLPFSMYVHKHV